MGGFMSNKDMTESDGGAARVPVGEPRSPETIGRRDPMKFSNGDVSLDRAVERTGGDVVLANASLLFDRSF